MCCRILGRSQRHLEYFRSEQRWPRLCSTPSLLFPSPLAKSRSCPSEESLKLVNLWASDAPHGLQHALLHSQCDSALWKRSTPPSVSLWADLVNGGASDLKFVAKFVEPVCQVMHRAGAQRAALSSRRDWLSRPLGSDIDANAGGKKERQLEIKPCCSLLRFWCLSIFFSHHLVFVDMLESLVGFLPGMWQQSIPDILWSDKVLRLFCCLHWCSVKSPSSSAP